MASVPRISVVMPVYSAEKYLRAAVQSVLDQTYREFELVVVDDGSNDESLSAMLKEFAAADPRVKIISRPNTGIVGRKAQRWNCRRFSPIWIARMDSDDLCEPERFEKQLAFLDANPDHVLVGTQVMLIDPEGASLQRKTRHRILPREDRRLPTWLIAGPWCIRRSWREEVHIASGRRIPAQV